ncbi:RNA polymerase sigma factor for flagellar operon FliA [Alkalithermobacter thermoalcaliphilus JW-YL-7 = DSM 7308]|uniref:RNA polymerase sigma factor for flagellar operon FliA n=1 Tax=Alkalithermobacter thermoalcaliphilus JW-YL-7 = DSM 7308 TaxID=1121328 RepID=A0A150FRF9_CLOPD|nr:RNA polymerase, sigma 28 subunit, FliA/WhiG [[Clostridium] paradoxum JW-YL-7 = DSM 7308]SHK60219.1 RNA polymerase sigma factor for flagellar operon FliA [[Clostridium] paradoxum JW-YL-7 = DSM 7308]
MDYKELWDKYKNTKDENLKSDIKKEIILKYLELVKVICGRLYNYYGANIEYDDLIGYGIIGLIDAIEKYDPNKNIKFETYASVRIRGTIIDEIRNLDWVPRSIRQKSKILKDTYSKLEMTLGREPTISEIANDMNKTEEEVLKLLEETSLYNIVSLEDELKENFKIQIKDESIFASPEEATLKKDDIDRLKKALEKLTDREKLIINLYYYEGLTYKEISSILKISESRISQIISKTILKLKSKLEII